MDESLLSPDMVVLLTLGLGGPLLGILRWAGRPQLATGIALLLAFGSLIALITGLSATACLPAGGLAGAYLLFAGAAACRDSLPRLLATPRTGLLFLALGPALAGAWACWTDHTATPPIMALAPRVEAPAPPPEPAPAQLAAYSDRGRLVPLFTRPVDDLPVAKVVQAEHWMTSGRAESLIRTGPPDVNYNCHGWVFADGHFWVRSEAVDGILTDNDYQAISKPRAGDVVVYRDEKGHVTHTGLVRLVTREQTIVESKWGHLGRFLHPVSDQPYAEAWTFYRSSRPGHVVRIGNSLPQSDTASE